MMIGGQFNTPADWTRAGNAVKTIDDFAATHDGKAPVLVFVDSGGAFNNDTECVNGVRGNAADHLTEDVVPFMVSTFGVSPNRASWGIAGWSMGGTCALDLTVMHPDMFSAFVDVAGDFYPNAGTKAQTIVRLFGGNAAAWAAFDPSTVIARHGTYDDVAGWFAISSDGPRRRAATSLWVTAAPCVWPGARPPPTPATRLRPRIHCARWAGPTGSTARSSPSRASTTGRSPTGPSPPRCRGWRAGWAPRGHPDPVAAGGAPAPSSGSVVVRAEHSSPAGK